MRVACTTLMFSVGALLAVGMVMLYSAAGEGNYLSRQLFGLGLGLIICMVATLMDYDHLKKGSIVFLVGAVVLLGLVLVPGIGIEAGGAQRWIRIAGVRFQPSELAKMALIIGLAHYGERYHKQIQSGWQGLVVPCFVISLIVGLVFVEPDRGTAVLMAGVSACMLLVAGVKYIYFLPPILSGIVGLAISLIGDEMRRQRILSWWDLESTKEGVGYQAYQAMLALGSGGWIGRGLGNGRQKLGFVPEHHTDFIFSIIGEELGLIGTLLVLVGFLALILSGIYIAWNSRDTFGLLLGSGITFLIGMQAFINIGVVTSALPNKGLPLPFIGFGGTNLMMMLTAVGILLSIALHSTNHQGQTPFARARSRDFQLPGKS